MPSTPRTQYAKSGDVSIAYQVVGDGPIDLVLVPGFVSHLDVDWDDPRHAHFLRRLASFSRLIRFDKRGTGLSDRPGGMPDLETRMDDVRAVMDAAGSERAALFGYSEGGPMSVLFAATYPEKTTALALYGTYAKRQDPDDEYPWARSREARQQYAKQVEEDWGWEADMRRMCPGADEAMASWWAARARASASPCSDLVAAVCQDVPRTCARSSTTVRTRMCLSRATERRSGKPVTACRRFTSA